jgi:hypothetical protein
MVYRQFLRNKGVTSVPGNHSTGNNYFGLGKIGPTTVKGNFEGSLVCNLSNLSEG